MHILKDVLFDYWGVWHFGLAIALWVFFWCRTANKQRAVFWTVVVAFGWELLEVLWNTGAYSSWRAQLGDSAMDIVNALIGIGLVSLLTIKSKIK